MSGAAVIAVQKGRANIGNIPVTNALVATGERTGGGGGGGLQILSPSSLEAIEERHRGIRQLEDDVIEVHQTFKCMAMIVKDHGDVIDNIEANIDTAAEHVETGNEQLVKASRYQKASRTSRSKLYCVIVIVVVAAGILALVIYFLAK